MKSATVATAAAVLAGFSMAQPHGHHHGHGHHHAKRELVTEWDTVWETVTLLVDESTTQTILPTPTGDGVPGQFFQPPSSSLSSTPTSTSEPEPTSTVAESTSTPSVQAPPPTSTVEPSSSSSQAPPPPATTSTSTSTSIPTPTPTPTPASTSSSSSELAAVAVSLSIKAPAPSSNSAASGYVYAGVDKFGTSLMDSKTYSGDITYYNLGLGACGYDDTGKDLTTNLVAISKVDWMARNPGTSLGIDMPNHPWCDQTITISAGGKTTTALVHDNCPGCASGSIDVSEAVFDALFGGLGVGRSTVTWSFE